MGGIWGYLGSLPIFFELALGSKNPPSPFKFNSEWLKDEIFSTLVKDLWQPIEDTQNEPTGIQMEINL
jgi:hypothetical protein